jgi:RimJ/RimL family protein N-acetyltransferase
MEEAGIGIRTFEAAEWEALRDFRLGALKAAPGVFAMPYDAAAALSAQEWQSVITRPGQKMFGLFDGRNLIGITGVVTDREDRTGQTALLVMSFIAPAYRGRGLSRLFYDARLAWIRAQPQFRRVRVSHRKSNHASRRANQRQGFVQTNAVPHTWPDGETEDEIFYELNV